jgi:hypothetical protein
MIDYPKEELWELYKYLPEDLQKATFSEEVGAKIQEICFNNEINDDDVIFEIIKNVGYVFLGLLPPNEFPDFLEKDLEVKRDLANKITLEITEFIFLPVQKSLENLYNIKMDIEIKKKVEEKIKDKDKYREPTE